MVEKFMVIVGEQVIGMKFDLRNGEVTLGGNVRFRELMENIITGYFIDRLPRLRFTQANKIRYSFTMSINNFNSKLEVLKENNFIIERVKSHGRLMR